MRERFGWDRFGRRSPVLPASSAFAERGAATCDAEPPPRSCATPGSTPTSSALEVDPTHLAFAPAVPALDRRRDEAPLDLAAARHRDRRLRPGRLGVPGRHAVLEGVLLRRPAGRDPLHRAAGRRALALRRLRVERRRPRGRARAASGAGAAPSTSAAAGRTRSPASATARSATRRAARRCSASACSSCRPTAIPARRMPSRSRRRRRPRRPRRARGCSSGCRRRCSRRRRGSPPRTPAERAALGYLHGNCGHCHNADGPLAQRSGSTCAT